jgi:hypothetical protein
MNHLSVPGSIATPVFRRLKLLALGISAALLQWATSAVHADSAVGVDMANGNALNPPGRSAMPRPLAPEALDTVRRSPSGQLYGIPYDLSDEVSTTEGGWEYTGGVEAGLMGGDASTQTALYRKYKDLKTGPYLNYFEMEAHDAKTARYLSAMGGGTGQSDQFYGFQYGRYNDWKVKLFYSETLHVFTDTYQQLYNGTGSGKLTLAGGLQPMGGATPVTSGASSGIANYVGAASTCTAALPCWRYTGADGIAKTYSNATAAAGINWTASATTTALIPGSPVSANSVAGSINTYLKTVDANTELSLVRQKAGASGEIRFTDNWKGYASYTQEQRKGARPFGMNENNYTAEIAEPIDYVTHDFLSGVSYVDSLTQANLRASISLFHNNISTLTVDQPWLAAATPFGGSRTTTFDLYPDNQAYNLKGEFARSLPDFYKGRFTAVAAIGVSIQDDALLMPVSAAESAQIRAGLGGSSIVAGINNPGYASNTLDLKNWDGTNGLPLSQSSSKQRIDTQLLNASLLVKPSEDLTVKGDIRQFATMNQGGYVAYNPLTGQFGRGFRNSTSFDLVVGSSGAPGAIGQPCYVLPGYPVVPGCTFNGNAGVAGQATNNPANIPVFSPARSTTQTNYVLSGDYDLGKNSSVNGALEREDFHRTFRERENTWEDKFKLGYVNRGFEQATLRMSYEDGRRRGSDYAFWPVGDFGTGLPGLDWNTIVAQYQKTAAAAPGWTVAPANMAGYLARYAFESRKYDQADRDQQVFNARLNILATEDMDLGISLQNRDVSYPNSVYGLGKDRLNSVNLEASYQPSSNQQFYGYYSTQEGRQSMKANAGTNAAGASNTCTLVAGGGLTTAQAAGQCAQQVWLADAAWTMDSLDKSDLIGLGFQTTVGANMRFGVDYTYSSSTSSVTYGYGANVLTAAQATSARANTFSDMTLVQNTLTLNLLIPIQKKASARLMYRHESGSVKDWHYTGIPLGASAAEGNATLMLDAGPQDYHTNIFGVMLQFLL